jgi:hypothetical protein
MRRMKDKLALLGASSSGKTSCAFALNGESSAGDMDGGELGVTECPTSEAMIAWILGCAVDVIAMSVHVSDPGMGIQGIRDLKLVGGDPRLGRIHFVYLNVSKAELEARARMRKSTINADKMAESLRAMSKMTASSERLRTPRSTRLD